MTEKQYAQLRWELGFLNGLSFAMPDDIKEKYFSSINHIDKILADIMNEMLLHSQK